MMPGGSEFSPSYVVLYENGELRVRVRDAVRSLEACRLCPNVCGVDRLENETDVCRTGRYAVVSSSFSHFGEESCLRGWGGSGTIFFSHCNLRCVFCQNYNISHLGDGVEMKPGELADVMLKLQDIGCHNVNFVTPSHVVPQILEALEIAVEGGLRLPLVYNTSGFDSLTSLKLLDGIIDIYMPDIKFWTEKSSGRYTHSKKYAGVVKISIREMHRQVGVLVLDSRGIARRGLLVRHLLMPGLLRETEEIFRFLSEEISSETAVNVMAQYRPAGKAAEYPELLEPMTVSYAAEAVEAARRAGLSRFF